MSLVEKGLLVTALPCRSRRVVDVYGVEVDATFYWYLSLVVVTLTLTRDR